MLRKNNSYPSFFTVEESKEIISELLSTSPLPYLPVCFGTTGDEPGTIEQLPWTDLLLSIKQFVEDRLDVDLNTAWLYSNLNRKKFSFLKDLEEREISLNRPFALIYFGGEKGAFQNGSLLLLNEGINGNHLHNFYKLRKNTGAEFVLILWNAFLPL